MDLSDSQTEITCTGTSCTGNVWYAENGKLKATITDDDRDQPTSTTVFCYDSQCDINIGDDAVLDFQITCGGVETDCNVDTGDVNTFFLNCYDGARCSLTCDGSCGDPNNTEDDKSFLNCESAAFCDVECTDDCDELEIVVGHAPLRIRSNSNDDDCIVRYDNDPSPGTCEEFQEACHPNLFVCDPVAYLKNYPYECRVHPSECPGANCMLRYLSIGNYNLNFHPYVHEYTVYVEPWIDYIQVYAEALDYDAQITVGDMQYYGGISASVGLSFGEEYTDVEVSICSPKTTTCLYLVRVVRDFNYRTTPEKTKKYRTRRRPLV
eukprot:TRINITY_DN5658_c0_g1_i1.p1 TRINITY_DN5658_c0_g1~~TRINITY_DN5658_c0_g1_i1.p1  ORF type:complete len:322 (+),score=49.69 TRINITY_DN5658_c0_g1_i1:397-1362(+)